MSRWWYLAALLVAFGGCGASLYFGLGATTSSVEDMERLVVPGSKEIELEPGSYTAYHESRSAVDGETYVNRDLPVVSCTLSREGEPIPLDAVPGDQSYEFRAYAGRAVFAFEADEAGAYRLRCDYEDPSRSTPAVVAVGSKIGFGIWGPVLGALGSIAVGLAVALLVFISRHRRHRRGET